MVKMDGSSAGMYLGVYHHLSLLLYGVVQF